MAAFNIFENDAFSLVEMSTAINRAPYRPNFLGNLGIFQPNPIRTTIVGVESKGGTLKLIPVSERGAPLTEDGRDRRNMRFFRTTRIAKSATLYADEIQGIRAFGTESELQAVQNEIGQRLNGPTGLLPQVEFTFENMRLGALQGKVLDADGATVLTDWFSEWGIAEPAEIDFALDDATTDIRVICAGIIRGMAEAEPDVFVPGVTVHALVGDAFYDALVTHPTVRETYLNYLAAAELRGALVQSDPSSGVWESFTYGGITFHNYRGSGSVSINTDKARFFPVGAPGLFQHVMSPAEFLPYVNTQGQRVYAMTIPDRDRQAWVKAEVYAYPLFMCTRPGLLFRGKRA